MNGLGEQYHGKLKVDIRNALSPQGEKERAALGFTDHGLVIYDADGNIITKLSGHYLMKPEIVKAVQKVMGEAGS